MGSHFPGLAAGFFFRPFRSLNFLSIQPAFCAAAWAWLLPALLAHLITHGLPGFASRFAADLLDTSTITAFSLSLVCR